MCLACSCGKKLCHGTRLRSFRVRGVSLCGGALSGLRFGSTTKAKDCAGSWQALRCGAGVGHSAHASTAFDGGTTFHV